MCSESPLSLAPLAPRSPRGMFVVVMRRSAVGQPQRDVTDSPTALQSCRVSLLRRESPSEGQELARVTWQAHGTVQVSLLRR